MDHNQRKCHTAMQERSPLFDIMIYSRDKPWLAGMFLTQEQMHGRSEASIEQIFPHIMSLRAAKPQMKRGVVA